MNVPFADIAASVACLPQSTRPRVGDGIERSDLEAERVVPQASEGFGTLSAHKRLPGGTAHRNMVIALLNHMPSAASESIFGVLTGAMALYPMQSYRSWSAMISSMLG